LHLPRRKSSQPDEAPGSKRRAGVKRLSGMCDDYPDQGDTVPTLHYRIDADSPKVRH
jgi:hypothetical protein